MNYEITKTSAEYGNCGMMGHIMCGRYNLIDNPALHRLLATLDIDIGPLPTRYNIAPTDPALTIYQTEQGYSAREMRWWLTPAWSDGPSQKFAMFNARSETIDKSRAYRGPFKRQRAIIPVSAFIEWQKSGSKKQPYLIEPTEDLLLMAAIWDVWQGDSQALYSCSMLTTAASDGFAHIHPRQPLMLNLDDAKAWLAPDQTTDVLHALMQQRLPQALTLTPIDSKINAAKLKAPAEPIGDCELISMCNPSD